MNLPLPLARLLALVRNRKLDRELDDEIRGHLELAELDALTSGLSPEEARRASLRSFGTIEAMKDEHREQRAVQWLDNLLRDFRYGLASLVRDPAFAAVNMGIIALAIGANAAMFSIVNAALLKPLPFPHPERMVRVWESAPEGRNGTTTLTFLDWKRQTDLFEALSVESSTKATVRTSGNPVRVPGLLVSACYFQVFAISPQLGRSFTSAEDQPGAAPVVIISHAFWQTQFAADPHVLNRDWLLDGVPHRIVGILPPGSFDREKAAFWKPLIFVPDQMNRGQHWLNPIGRLRPGVTLQQAQARLTILRASLDNVIYQKDWGFAIDPFTKMLVGDTLRRSLYLALGAVVTVLLIACANLANLALAKGAARQKEMAVRAALGAGRKRLIAQLLTESLVICLLGGLAGLILGAVLLRIAAPVVASSLPFTADLTMDWRVLGFAALAVTTVLILTGLLPSLNTSFGRLSAAINRSGRGTSAPHASMRRAIVIAEVAASVVLICGAALLFKSLLKLQQVDPGARIDHIITMSADLPAAAYPTPQSAANFYDAVATRLQTLPGVESVGISQSLPLQHVPWGEYMRVPGVPDPILVRLKLVDPGYFRALGIPLLTGRGIDSRDHAGTPPITVINQEAARRLATLSGTSQPIGRSVAIDVPGYGPIPESQINTRIVGVIRSERTAGLNAPPEPVAYLPLAQAPQQPIKLLVRTRTDPAAAVPALREAIRRLDPNLALADVLTMEQIKQDSTLWARQPTWVVGAFAALAALLAAIGLYGVLAHAVTQQRREISIRMALGARTTDVLSRVLRSACLMLLIGLAIGLAGAFALTRVLKSLLFQVSTLDPAALATACALMAVTALLAAWIPARRAATVDPMTVLRDEG